MMKNITFTMLILLALLLLACSKDDSRLIPTPTPTPEATQVAASQITIKSTPEPTPKQTPEVTPEPIVEPTPEPAPDSFPNIDEMTLTQDEIDKVNQKIEENTNYFVNTFLSTSVKEMWVGESYKFALGIKNNYNEERRIRAKSEIVRAQTLDGSGSNDLFYKRSFLLTWIGDGFYNEVTIPAQGTGLITLPITIGPERSQEVPTIPGYYVFGFSVEEYDPEEEFWETYSNEVVNLALKVK